MSQVKHSNLDHADMLVNYATEVYSLPTLSEAKIMADCLELKQLAISTNDIQQRRKISNIISSMSNCKPSRQYDVFSIIFAKGSSLYRRLIFESPEIDNFSFLLNLQTLKQLMIT